MLCPGHNCRFSSLLARSAISEGSSSDSDDHSNSPRQDRHLLSSIRLSAGFFGSIVDIVNKKACFGNKSSALLNVSLLLSVYLFCPRAHLAPPLGPVPSRSSPVPLSLPCMSIAVMCRNNCFQPIPFLGSQLAFSYPGPPHIIVVYHHRHANHGSYPLVPITFRGSLARPS